MAEKELFKASVARCFRETLDSARMLLSHLIKRRPLLSLEQIETAHRLVEAALIERGHDPGHRRPGRARAWSSKAIRDGSPPMSASRPPR